MIKEKKLVIYGSFLDSYIYSNNLILLDYNLNLRSYSWNSLILNQNINRKDLLAYKCAFLQSDYLYGFAARDLFFDPEVKALIEEKFNRIENLHFDIDGIEKYASTQKPVELAQFTTDIGVYNNELFYCNSSGVFSKNLRKYDKNLISKKERMLWDCPAQCLKIGNRGRIALSSSSDGLFEINTLGYMPYLDSIKLVERYDKLNILQVSSEHSSYCSWSFSSLFTGSYIDDFKLFGFKSIRNDWETAYNADSEFVLNYQGEFTEREIFDDTKENSLIFAGNEKLYRISEKSIDVVNYSQGNLGTDNEIFQKLGAQELPIIDEVIEAAVVEFGVVIETKTQLFVKLSTGRLVLINSKAGDEVVRWRVFPRSNCYVNQLHVIFNDRIEIISFNEDYFVDQNQKVLGQRFEEKYRNK